MPKAPLHTLIWSTDQSLYDLHSRGQLVHRFRPADHERWRSWLDGHTAFVFQGHAGRINLHNEPRTRTRRYWYAYHSTSQRTKRYLGPTATLTFERLEQVAGELSGAHLPAPDVSHAPSPASGALTPARGGRIQPGDCLPTRDFPGHGQETREQSAWQARRGKPDPGDCTRA